MSNHYHEHLNDIVGWPWKLFCRMWARMLIQVAEREQKEREHKAEREREEKMRELVDVRERMFGGDVKRY